MYILQWQCNILDMCFGAYLHYIYASSYIYIYIIYNIYVCFILCTTNFGGRGLFSPMTTFCYQPRSTGNQSPPKQVSCLEFTLSRFFSGLGSLAIPEAPRNVFCFFFLHNWLGNQNWQHHIKPGGWLDSAHTFWCQARGINSSSLQNWTDKLLGNLNSLPFSLST